MNKKTTPKKKKPIISEAEKLRRGHIKDIRSTMVNIGFTPIKGINGNSVIYNGVETEFDDFFVYENLILITEYTSEKHPADHLKKKKIIYDIINKSHRDFIDFILKEPKYSGFKDYYYNHINNKYSIGQIRLRIIYCSQYTVGNDHKKIFEENESVFFYDYVIVQYFRQLAMTIKRSARYELFAFLKLKPGTVGPDCCAGTGSNKYIGNILPVERSDFNSGYNVVSFYIDANSLIRRAYVLRQESWREDDPFGFYQRMVDAKKIYSMRKFLGTEKRVFINNIIATISEDSVSLFDTKNHEIKINNNGLFEGNDEHDIICPTSIQIEDKPNIIGIIDGQHRVFAYHEGTDIYEDDISILRKRQHLLVTAILFPKSESTIARRKFEATLFREINNTQTNIKSALKQQIDLMISPFSPTAIAKGIIYELNDNSPLQNLFEMHSYEKGKLKTASIVSFGLSPLIKYDDSPNSDSLYKLWSNSDKTKLNKECEDIELKKQYVSYCVCAIRDILIALRRIVDKDLWHIYDPKTKQGQLSVTFINGILNVLRCQIKENNTLLSQDEYYEKLKTINFNKLRDYKSSQYNKMGHYIFETYFK